MKVDPLQRVLEERARQDAKWGEQNHSDLRWLPILSEEVGEVAKYINEETPGLVEAELVHVAAVAMAWLECIERNRGLRRP
jgi:NTP pyrophosphatase (non-canonical NTP hydrolase)